MPAEVAAHMDSTEVGARKDLLSCMRKWCRNDDIGQVGSAIAEVLAATGRVKLSDVEMMIARMGGFGLGTEPDTGPDLKVYDEMLGGECT